jgi:hypothetical protein
LRADVKGREHDSALGKASSTLDSASVCDIVADLEESRNFGGESHTGPSPEERHSIHNAVERKEEEEKKREKKREEREREKRHMILCIWCENV